VGQRKGDRCSCVIVEGECISEKVAEWNIFTARQLEAILKLSRSKNQKPHQPPLAQQADLLIFENMFLTFRNAFDFTRTIIYAYVSK
jgi:hypothetical protein